MEVLKMCSSFLQIFGYLVYYFDAESLSVYKLPEALLDDINCHFAQPRCM